jgi:hypothetical protein
MSDDGDRLESLDKIRPKPSTRAPARQDDETEEKATKRSIAEFKKSHALKGLVFACLG